MYKNMNVSPSAQSPIFGVLNLVGERSSVEFDYSKGVEIFGASEPAEYVYQVMKGAVRSYTLLSDGRRQIAAFHLPGDIFGLEFGGAHRFSAEAVVPTKLRLIKSQRLEHLARTHIPMMLSLLEITGRTLDQVEDHLLLLGQKTALERVANFLVEMEHRSAAAGVLALCMSRLDIADYLGLTIETVSRALSELKRQGLIKFMGTQRDIVVVNAIGLAEIDRG